MKSHSLFEDRPFVLLEMSEIEEQGQKRPLIKGVFQRANEKNANGRIYPDAIIEREVKKLQERIAANQTTYMQADHPNDGQSRFADTTAILKSVRYDKASKEVVGEAVVLNTHRGQDLQEVLRAKGQVGVSSRGFGTTKPGEYAGVSGDVVQEDYSLVTFDFVVGQSTRDAVVTSFVEQARMYGQLTEDEEMDIKTLDLGALKAARPELFTQIQDEAKKEADKNLKAEVASAVAEAEKEWNKKRVEATDEQLQAELVKRGFKVEKKSTKDEEDMEEKKLREEAEKAGFTLTKKGSPTAALEQQIAKLQTELNDAKKVMETTQRQTQTLNESQSAAVVKAHIFEKCKDEKKFKNALIGSLLEANYKSTAEVDAQIDNHKTKIEKLLLEATGGRAAGTGHANVEETTRNAEDGKVKAKGENGQIMELTESELRMRTMAGLKTELVS